MTHKPDKPEKCECHLCTLLRAGVNPGMIGDHFHSRKRKAGGMPSTQIWADARKEDLDYSPSPFESAIMKYLDEQEAGRE